MAFLALNSVILLIFEIANNIEPAATGLVLAFWCANININHLRNGFLLFFVVAFGEQFEN